MSLEPLFSSGKDDWQTPDVVLEMVRRLGPIILDPATSPDNPTNAAHFLTEKDNGLSRPWNYGGLIFVNPPYSQMKQWAWKIATEATIGADPLVALVPARTDTAWWATLMEARPTVAFWRGRLKFKGAPSGAPFPSALLFYNVPPDVVAAVFVWRACVMTEF